MSILTRYLLKQHARPFLFALSALTCFELIRQIARKLGDLMGKGLPWTVILEFFLLTIRVEENCPNGIATKTDINSISR